MNSKLAYTVTQINNHAKSVLENSIKRVYVKGEVSSFKKYESRNAYFLLKDNKSEISCTIINYNYPFDINDGENITIFGNVSIYTFKGKFQLLVHDIYKSGVGEQLVKLSELKNKFQKEGLFDSIYKKDLPAYPAKIAIITSDQGAVLNDIINIIQRRSPYLELLVYNTLVQGKTAVNEISKGIDKINKIDDVDIMIIARGGGSFEDLMPFNNEQLVRKIFLSHIPVISAIGHDSDITLADLVADVRASTPSEAAELASPNIIDLQIMITNILNKILKVIKQNIVEKKHLTESISSKLVFKSQNCGLNQKQIKIENFYSSICNSIFFKVDKKYDTIINNKKILKQNNITSLKKMGFSIIRKNNIIVNDKNKLNFNDVISIDMHNGVIKAKVEK